VSSNLPAVRRRRIIQNLKAGDKIKFLGLRPDIPYGIISSTDGPSLMVVVENKEGERWDQEIYREEVTERLAEYVPVPITSLRLKYLLEMAQPEDIDRKSRRQVAQEEIMDLLEQGQIFRTSNGVWGINPEWGK
jgi:hypothetical protein